MTILTFRADAQPRRQETKITPAGLEIGSSLTVTINRKDVTVEIEEGDGITSASSAAVLINHALTLLVAAIAASEIPEFEKLTASTYTDDDTGLAVALKLLGPETGEPFTVTASAGSAGNFSVGVSTVQAGAAATNEIQRVILPGPPTGGTFTLTFDGQTTGAIAFNASAATITTALEALSNIAPGDVTVTGDAPDFTVEFAGAYEGVNVPIMTGSGASLTGGAAVNIATTTEGAGGTNEVQRVTLQITSANAGTPLYYWRVSFGGVSSGWIHRNDSAATIQAALEAVSTIGAGNVQVTKSEFPSTPWQVNVTFIGALGSTNVAALVADPEIRRASDFAAFDNDVAVVSTITEGSSSGVNEVQTVTIANAPTGGTFTLTFSGQTTAGIAFNAADTDVQTALEGLSTIGGGEVAVMRTGSGTLASPYVHTVTFQNGLGSLDVAQMTASAASLTGSAVSIATTQEAAAGTNEQQSIALTGSPTGGTFTLTWNAETTAALDFDATAAEIQTALEGLATPAPGDFTVTGAAGGPWIVTFTGTYAATDVAEITGDGTNLTGTGSETFVVGDPNEVEPTGPNWWSEPENWSTGNLPVNGDIVFLKDLAVDVLYGLEDLAAVTLAELHIDLSMTGNIGHYDMHEDGYWQYLPKYLKQPATLLFIGEGEGPGSDLWRLDTAAVATTLIQYASGDPDGNLPAVQWIGTNAANVAYVLAGSFGAAAEAGTAAVLATLHLGKAGDVGDDGPQFAIGSGCNLDNVTMSGGEGVIDLSVHALGDLVASGGTVRLIGDQGVDLIQLAGEAVCYYSTTGTLGGQTVVTDEARLDFTEDPRPKTVTNPIDVYSRDAGVVDPDKVVTSLVIDFNNIEVTDQAGSEYGNNVRLTRGAIA